jgi:hypothetical protein
MRIEEKGLGSNGRLNEDSYRRKLSTDHAIGLLSLYE